jgi:signal transduction histidine kinase
MSESRSEDTSLYLRTELLERIAHELRGPTGVTLGALDEIEHALGAEVVNQNRVLFAMARRGAKRVLRTAERLTRTALLESGSPHISRTLGDLRGVVQQAVQEAEQIEGRGSIKLELAIPAEPCIADFDSGWLTVAIGELVSQAIRCARRQVSVVLDATATSVRVSVSDDRTVVNDTPAARFVSLEDRRDSSLGWPLVCDVANAHDAELNSEPLRNEAGGIAGLRITLQLKASG